MSSEQLKVAYLLFCSGMCALIYQTAWTRELRLIFGASTPASAAVLAIFLGGLGLGGIVLGRRAERHPRPLALYAQLEFLIAGSAALTPVWIWLVRRLYGALGGSVTLGLAGGTVTRLLLSMLVLSLPTVLMGGTLPAAARAVEDEKDSGRRQVAILYGVNTLGAVLGTLLSTFVLLERYGNRLTLWMACAVNLLVAYVARELARGDHPPTALPEPPATAEPSAEPPGRPLPPLGFVLFSAAVAGLAFLLMELVWYRMLGPILGGSTFTFGLILAVALLGIGLGGAGYALLGQRRPPTLRDFSVLCLLEALFIIAAYALGDRLALLALLLRPLAALGFFSYVCGWFLVTCVVVLPAAFISGWQFPVLIALLGRGKTAVGRHVGLAYAWNTVGSILGSLAGGFGLLPLLSAPGVWRLSAGLLCGLGVAAGALALYTDRREHAIDAQPVGRGWLGLALATAAATLILLQAEGPTPVWRHSGIGVGRAQVQSLADNSLRSYVHARRRAIAWEKDGVESSVALSIDNSGMAFVVNGKADGNARGDAATQVVSGIVGAVLHPQPRRALVVGLGTGSTAGWLGAIPDMERVDVAEIEPNILHIARACAPVNQDVLKNPKVHTFIGDGRELLLTTRELYDLVVSEPSNPYRAGIASMYTQEYYRSVKNKLTADGLFLQWAQTYDVDNQTVHTIYATLASSFPVVETWMTQTGDLLLIGALHPIRYDVPALRARIQTEPLKSALAKVWRVTNLEGFLAHYVARDSLARMLAKSQRGPLNSDDLTPAEFGFGRSLGVQEALFRFEELLTIAHDRKEDVPELTGGSINPELLDRQRIALYTANEEPAPELPFYTPAQRQLAAAQSAFVDGNLLAAIHRFRQLPGEPADLAELTLAAEGLAELKDDAALPFIEKLRGYFPGEADALRARLLFRKGQIDEAAVALESALRSYQSDPWPALKVMLRALSLAVEMSQASPPLSGRFVSLLQQPFAVGMLDDSRHTTLFALSELEGFTAHCAQVVAQVEPYVPWQQDFLLWRLNCYRLLKLPQTSSAFADLNLFLAQKPKPFAAELK